MVEKGGSGETFCARLPLAGSLDAARFAARRSYLLPHRKQRTRLDTREGQGGRPHLPPKSLYKGLTATSVNLLQYPRLPTTTHMISWACRPNEVTSCVRALTLAVFAVGTSLERLTHLFLVVAKSRERQKFELGAKEWALEESGTKRTADSSRPMVWPAVVSMTSSLW